MDSPISNSPSNNSPVAAKLTDKIGLLIDQAIEQENLDKVVSQLGQTVILHNQNNEEKGN